MFVNFNILNQLGSPAINSNTFANRPAAGQTGRLFVSTDTFEIYRDNGTTWDLIGGPGSSTITGTGTATQVAYFTSSQAIGSDSNLFWDNANIRLGIGTSSPGARLDVHGSGIVGQFNGTTSASNIYLAFQRGGVNLWRVGDMYNSGQNFFEIRNSVLSNNAVEILATSNEATFLSTKTYSTGNAIGIAVQHNLTIPNGVNVGLAALGGINSNLNLTLQGSTTVANTGRQGLEGSTSISFTGAGTLTMTQGSTVRAFSALSSVYAFNGSAVGTITHLAGLRICFPDNVGSAVNITNNYALLINNQTTGLGTVTYTNRWGIYQEGASDLNYFAANMLLGSTVNNGDKLQVTGTASISGALSANNYVATGGNNTTILNSSAATTGWVQIGMNNTSGSALLGVESSVAGTLSTGSTAYATILRNYTNTNLQIATNNIVRATFDTVGNLGIGTTSPKTVTNGLSLTIGDGATQTQPYLALARTATGGYWAGIRWYDNANIKSYIEENSDFDLKFGTINTERMRITSAGNVGIGVTPSAWGSLVRGLQVAYGASFSGNTAASDAYMTSNAYFDGTNWKYINTGNNALSFDARGNGGTFVWLNAPSGTAGNNITFTQAMTLGSNGNLLIGTTTDAGQKLYLNGSLRIDGQTSGTAGGSSGQHLIINCDGTTYKIALLNN